MIPYLSIDKKAEPEIKNTYDTCYNHTSPVFTIIIIITKKFDNYHYCKYKIYDQKNGQTPSKYIKIPIISFSYTTPEPWAVMVKPLHTVIAYSTV